MNYSRNNLKNNMSRNVEYYLKNAAVLCFILILFPLFLFGCINIKPAEQTESSDIVSGAGYTQENTKRSVYAIKEIAEQDNIKATLLSVTVNEGNNYWKPKEGYVYLICEFEIENNGQEDISVSSILSFCTYIDGKRRDLSLMAGVAYGEKTADGTVKPGEKLRGAVGYEAPKSWKELKIYFTPDMMNKNAMVFSAENTQMTE